MNDAAGGVSPRRAVVITASTRAAAGVYVDRSGEIVAERLRAWGFEVEGPVVVADGDATGAALRDALDARPALVITTGGTGLRADDRTPEQTAPLLDAEVPGIAEAIRAAGLAQGVPTAMLSRGLAGVARGTLVVNLPGSTGGVMDALTVLEPVVHHALDQIAGGDH
ncbi:MAG: MogA/MoaB family molybdenum cofactor biosynthesis protein [Mobilicoccus sp.]|nr:MogA/MoaB family molybdenum cofactor biosynthesis protein [Mobilicoccus sp.]